MPSRDINDLTKDLQRAYLHMREKYMRRFPGREVILVCTRRSPAEQAELYQSGRSRPGPVLTNCDGVRKLSPHNSDPSRAFDLAVIDGGKYRADARAYEPLGGMALETGIVWGGSWKKLRDFCHFEQKEAK
ncbi:MAG: M15 family metallopeptidase [Elusimicrobiales bacterium]